MAQYDDAPAALGDGVAFFLRQLVGGIIAAFHVNIRRGEGEQAGGARFIKNTNGIDRLKGGEHERAVVLGIEGAAVAFEFAHGTVAVDEHEQGVGLRSRGGEIIHMAGVEQIKTAVRDGEFFATGAQVFAPSRERVGGEQLRPKIHGRRMTQWRRGGNSNPRGE